MDMAQWEWGVIVVALLATSMTTGVHLQETTPPSVAGVSPLLRRWRLNQPTPLSSDVFGDDPLHDDEELDEVAAPTPRQRRPGRRSLQWLPSGLGTHWDLRGTNTHAIRHSKHRNRTAGAAVTRATAGTGTGSNRNTTESLTDGVGDGTDEAEAAEADGRRSQSHIYATLRSSSSTASTSTSNNETDHSFHTTNSHFSRFQEPVRFAPLALTSASRGIVAEVVQDSDSDDLELEEEKSAVGHVHLGSHGAGESVRIRPLPAPVDVACYSSNQVLVIIALTCGLSLGFIALVMGCVHCCTPAKEADMHLETSAETNSPLESCRPDVESCECMGILGRPRPRPWHQFQPHPRLSRNPHSIPSSVAAATAAAAAGSLTRHSVIKKLVAALRHHHRLHRLHTGQMPHRRCPPRGQSGQSDSEEDLLFPASNEPGDGAGLLDRDRDRDSGSGSASTISLHSLGKGRPGSCSGSLSARERQCSISMEDLLLLGR